MLRTLGASGATALERPGSMAHEALAPRPAPAPQLWLGMDPHRGDPPEGPRRGRRIRLSSVCLRTGRPGCNLAVAARGVTAGAGFLENRVDGHRGLQCRASAAGAGEADESVS